MAALERQRLIERRQGIGTRIAEATSERELFHFFRVETREGIRPAPTSLNHSLATGPADREELAALKLEPGARVHRLLRERRLGGAPVIAELIVLPEALFPGFAAPLGAELTDELYVLYQRRFGVTIPRVEEQLQAVAATPDVAGMLGRAEGAPLLLVARTAFDVMGRPVELRRSWLDTAQIHYAVELR